MRLRLPKVRVHESEARRRNLRLSGKGGKQTQRELRRAPGKRREPPRRRKRKQRSRLPERTREHAPSLNSKNNSSEIPVPVQGATTCPSTYVRCSE